VLAIFVERVEHEIVVNPNMLRGRLRLVEQVARTKVRSFNLDSLPGDAEM
jgi:hypothetical protein